MGFHSLNFIFIFLPITFLAYLCLPKAYKKIALIAMSCLFYAWGEPIYIFGLILLVLFNYKFALIMDQKQSSYRQKCLFWILLLNIFIFFYFKYYDFILQTFFQILHITLTYEVFSAPLGISFFMFSIIGYQIDVYKKKYPAERDLVDFALFVSFFPKLTMGPIMSYEAWRENRECKITLSSFHKGATHFIIGLAQKVILAEEMGQLYQMFMSSQMNIINTWLMTLSFAFQLYFDFNGYTHMAIGLGQMFGFQLPKNFDYPYLSTSIAMFWRRWHITLGAWFREYIYIPLGGNRVSHLKWVRNMLIVWMTTGLWHGANWTFVLWGLYHGIFIIIEKLFLREKMEKLPIILQIFFTFLIVNIGWVFFYSSNFQQAFSIICAMFDITSFSFLDLFYNLREYGIIFMICALTATPFVANVSHQMNRYRYKPLLEIVVMFVLFFISIAFLLGSSYQSFMYSAF